MKSSKAIAREVKERPRGERIKSSLLILDLKEDKL